MVDVLEAAQLEMLEAAAFFEDQRSGLGFRFIDEFKHALSVLADRPLTAPPYLKDGAPPGVRHLPMTSFPHSVVFIMAPQPIVVGVVSGHRRPNYWRERVVRAH